MTCSLFLAENHLAESLMDKWLERQCLRDVKCIVHDLEFMGSNPGWVELGVHNTSV